MAGGGAILLGGVAVGFASIPPLHSDPPLWSWLLWAVVVAGAMLLLWGGLGLAVWTLRQSGRSIQLARAKAGSFPRIRVVVERPTPNINRADGRGQRLPMTGSATASRWLPDPTNLLSLQMSNEDLDACIERARKYAQQLLGRDAKVFFVQMTLGTPVEVLFAGQSDYAGRVALIHVREDSIEHDPPRDGPWFIRLDEEDGGREYDFDPGPDWHRDDTWRDFVAGVWKRVRPFDGSLVLQSQEFGDRGWSLTARSARGGERTFFQRDGVILEWNARPAMPTTPAHGLTEIGGTLLCLCGARFATGPEFEAHLKSSRESTVT